MLLRFNNIIHNIVETLQCRVLYNDTWFSADNKKLILCYRLPTLIVIPSPQ